MALIKCPECGKEISDKALSCPNCAFPMTEILKSVDKPTVENDVDVAVGEENNGEENAVAMTYNDTSSNVDESVKLEMENLLNKMSEKFEDDNFYYTMSVLYYIAGK